MTSRPSSAAQWDTVYHEHLRFYDPYSFHLTAAAHGLAALSWAAGPDAWRVVPDARGAGRERGYKARRRAHYDFDGLARTLRPQRDAIRERCRRAATVGIGATAGRRRSSTTAALTLTTSPYVCEVAGVRQDRALHPRHPHPGRRRGDGCSTEQPDRAILFSWHMADVIVPKLRERGYTGEIIVPLPTLRTL
jgi:hypothetical protein